MLNYETLLSSYDDKLTLMQWLKKVEEALKDASAVSFNVNKRGDATLTFSVVFEDGSELESNPITLQQGESVASAYISNGNLHLVLTNGDDLNAGNMFNGNITIAGSLQVNDALKVSVIDPISGDNVPFTGGGDFNGDVNVNDGDVNVEDGHVSTPILTSANDKIEAEKPVVEVMTGYGFTKQSGSYPWTPIYVGISKNGNKLTFVIFGEITIDTYSALTSAIAFLRVPSGVGTKLIPYSVGALSNVLVVERINCASSLDVNAEISYVFYKLNNQDIEVSLRMLSNLQVGTTYKFRLEQTFLLSDNLAA